MAFFAAVMDIFSTDSSVEAADQGVNKTLSSCASGSSGGKGIGSCTSSAAPAIPLTFDGLPGNHTS